MLKSFSLLFLLVVSFGGLYFTHEVDGVPANIISGDLAKFFAQTFFEVVVLLLLVNSIIAWREKRKLRDTIEAFEYDQENVAESLIVDSIEEYSALINTVDVYTDSEGELNVKCPKSESRSAFLSFDHALELLSELSSRYGYALVSPLMRDEADQLSRLRTIVFEARYSLNLIQQDGYLSANRFVEDIARMLQYTCEEQNFTGWKNPEAEEYEVGQVKRARRLKDLVSDSQELTEIFEFYEPKI